MKPGIRPDYRPVDSHDATTGAVLVTHSTGASARIDRGYRRGVHAYL